MTIRPILTSLALLGSASMLSAAVIHIDINGAQTTGTAGNFNGTPATVLGSSGDTWNYVTPGNKTVGSLLDLKDATNTTTTVDVSWTANHYSYDNSTGAGNYRDLLGDYAYIHNGGGGQATSTWTLSGLTAGGIYNIVLYTSAGTAGAQWNIGGDTKVATGGTVNTALDSGLEYVKYSNLVADGTGKIDILFQIRSGQSFGEMSGIEIQAVPEPSAALLGGLGLLALLRRRR